MLEFIKKATLLTLLVIVLIACNHNNFIEYKPHYLSKNSEYKYYGEPQLDSITFKNTIQVLEFYGEDYKTKNGNIILIPKQLSQDWELVWNYTMKAENDNWLKTHTKE